MRRAPRLRPPRIPAVASSAWTRAAQRNASGAAARPMDLRHAGRQLRVGPCPSRGLALAPGPVAAGGDPQHVAESDDGGVGLLAVHERGGAHRIALVSCAKKAAAFFRLSRSSRTIRCARRSRCHSSCSQHGPAILAPALIPIGRFEPLAPRLGRHAQLARNLRLRLSTRSRQSDRLSSKLRWIRWFAFRPGNPSFGGSSPTCTGVYQTGSTPPLVLAV